MRTVDLLCLAFSYKHGYRCVAGLNLDDGSWIRPVSALETGELARAQYSLSDGRVPAILDLVRIAVERPKPALHQPENWLLATRRWELISRPAPPSCARLLAAAIESEPRPLLGFPGREITIERIGQQGGCRSLALVRPGAVRWWTDEYERKKARVAFRVHDSRYDLPVTDPRLFTRLTALDVGCHADHEVELAGREYLFCISLTQPFNGVCYKLVAGVISLPDGWTAGGGQ